MKNLKVSNSPDGVPTHDQYLPIETYLKKGLISYIVPQTKGIKFKDSSLTFFDLNSKEIVLYDLKKWFKTEEDISSFIPKKQGTALIADKGTVASSAGAFIEPSGISKQSLKWSELDKIVSKKSKPWGNLSRLAEADQETHSAKQGATLIGDKGDNTAPKRAIPKVGRKPLVSVPLGTGAHSNLAKSSYNKGENIELSFLNSSITRLSPMKAPTQSWFSTSMDPSLNNSELSSLDWSQWVLNATPFKKLDKIVPSFMGSSKLKGKSLLLRNKRAASAFYSPDQNRQFINWINSWTYLSKQLKSNQYVTGRIGRSLKRAGVSVWLAGVTSFLPYREYTLRNKIMPSFEGQLKTFQIVSLNPSNLNCVLTRDKAIQSIIYRASKSPEEMPKLSPSPIKIKRPTKAPKKSGNQR